MKKIASLLSAAAFLVILCGGSALFAQDNETVTFEVNLAAYYNLSIGQTTITFTDVAPSPVENPPAVSIPANQNPVSVTAFAIMLPGTGLKLTVTANGNLSKGSGSDIDISAINWTVTGAGYQDGTLQNLTEVKAGQWGASVFHYHAGSFSYFFARDYKTQEPGDYTATATYTLSAV